MTAWQEFLNEIKSARAKLACKNTGAWYRGHNSTEYQLIPKLLRNSPDTCHSREREIYENFTRRFGQQKSSWSELIIMQHHGTATRLLDWTEVFGVALYFALNPTLPSTPCIWITNPFTLSAKARRYNNKTIGAFHLDGNMDYYEHFIKARDWPYERPIPFFSPANNERIIAQRGFFTVHGNSIEPLEVQCPRHVYKVVLPMEALNDAREFLDLAGFNKLSLFPDYEGFSSYIHDKYL